jgi:MFS family permease
MYSLEKMRSGFLGSFGKLPPALWAVFFIQIIVRGGDFVFPFLTLFLTRRLGLGSAEAGLWVMSTSIIGLVGTLLGGRLSDRFGRRLILGLFMLADASLLGSCAFLAPSLLVPRLLLVASLFQGAMKPLTGALVMDLCPPERRREGFSLSYLGTNLGVAVGPLVAGFLFESHLPLMFFGNSLALGCAFALLFLFVRIPAAPQEAGRGLEGVFQGNALSALVARPRLALFYGLTLLLGFAYSQTNFGLALYMSAVFGAAGSADFGLLMSFNAVSVLASTALIMGLTRGWAALSAMAVGTGLYALGFGMLAFHLALAPLLLSTLIWTLGEVLLAINTGPFLASQTPSNFRGRFQGLRDIMWAAGSSLSPLICGAVIARRGIHLSWLLTAGVALCCALGFALMGGRARLSRAESTSRKLSKDF